MTIYLGADHRGFNLKELLKKILHEQGYEVVDLGNTSYDEKDDYPDFAAAVAKKVSLEFDKARGILICASGVGVDVVANKYPGVRSALAISSDQIYDARHDDDVNILSLAADFVDEEGAEKIVKVFLETPFAGEEQYKKRILKISDIEGQ